MKKLLLSLLSISLLFSSLAQTTIDFDDDTKWTAGSGGGITSYQPDHSYTDGDFSATGGPGLRQGNALQNGIPGALGTYSWRLRDNVAVIWTATIATGGISTFSIDARAWDNTPSPDYKIETSIDAGVTWDSITTINNTTLSNGMDWVTFNGTVNSANNDILVRLIPNGTTERIMIDNFTWSPFGSSGNVDTTASISSADQTVLENAGSVTVTVTLNQAATNTHTVDLALVSGNAAVLGNYTTQTITFSGGSTSESVTINITQGQLVSSSETFDFELINPSSEIVLGTDINYSLTVNQLPANPSACSELFISEYLENAGNKAIEIYNPTTQIVDLSGYELRRYSNGASTPSSTLSMAGSLIPGGVYVIASGNSDQAILDETDLISGVIAHTGDDAYELYNTVNSSTADIFGEIGVDPGTSWTVGAGTTEDVTLVRMSTIDNGNLTWIGGSDQEWNVEAQGDYSFLGSHSNSGCPLPAFPVAYPLVETTYCQGDTIFATHNSFGGTTPYSVQWTINSIPVSTNDTLIYEALVSTSLSVTLTITDSGLNADDSTFTITINPLPNADYTMTASTICAEDTTYITSTGNGTGLLTHSYFALPNSGVLNTNISGDGYFTSATDGSFDISQVLMDGNGCMDTATYSVVVNVLDDASFTPLNDICDTETLSLNHSNNTGTWSGTGVTDNSDGSGSFTSSTTGDQYITFTTSGVCPDAYTDTVAVFATPTANFTYSGALTLTFSDASSGSVASYDWDFGDGNTDTQQNPTHTYANDATYTVCLDVTSADGCSDQYCETISIFGNSVSENNLSGISFYPNPAEGILNVTTNDNTSLTIYNVLGERILTTRINGSKTISLDQIESGSYFIQFEKGGNVTTEKLIIK